MNSLSIILLSIVVFTGLIIVLVSLLNYASSKLVNTGSVKIVINDDESKTLTVPAGSTLLSTLAAEKIFLPSACGGGGTCAMCTCQIMEGGGEILPTETSAISYKKQKENWRLSCQVKVKNDLKIRIPDEVFNIQKFNCRVRSNNNVATFIKELVLELPEGQHLDFKAGGYIQIDVPPYDIEYKNFIIGEEYRGDWERFKLFDLKAKNAEPIFRAYSMANYPDEKGIVMLNIRIATPPPGLDVPPGLCSSYVFNLKSGDPVTISGPYGEFFVKETEKEMMFIGGGAGMAPMRSHVFNQLKRLKTQRKATFWYGARSRREMFYDDEFKDLEKNFPNFSYNVALSEPLPEDKWEGPVGFIHRVILDNYLSKHEDPTEIEYYLCGPPMMISAVNKMLYDLGVDKESIMYDEF